MRPPALDPLDPREPDDFARDLRAAGRGYLPTWDTSLGRPDGALVEIAARYLSLIVQRLNQLPLKNRLALLDMFGVSLLPAQAAMAPVVFRLPANAGDVRAPAGTRVAAPPPVDDPRQLVFETERTTDLTAGALVQVVSLWPGRDQYIDHTAAGVAREPFRPWELKALRDIPHEIYIRHDELLALSGESRVVVRVDLRTHGNRAMEVVWEYWDGAEWRGFEHARPDCGEYAIGADGTDGLRQSGTYLLLSACAEAAKRSVHGVEGFWIRGRLDEPLPPDPAHVLPSIDQVALETEVRRPLAYRIEVQDTPASTPAVPVTVEVVVSILSGLLPDGVMAGVLPADPTTPFQPFGPVPQPGAALYLKHDEAFAIPGATVDLLIAWERMLPNIPNLFGPTQRLVATDGVLEWEYWNGRLWVWLPVVLVDGDDLFAGIVDVPTPPRRLWTKYTFTVPDDIAPRAVNDDEGLWIRVRLVGGDYTVTIQPPLPAGIPPVALVPQTPAVPLQIPVPPVVTHVRLGYQWGNGPCPPTTLLTYNDFRFAERTDEATLPGAAFEPFTPSTDPTPALYLGFDKPPPVGRIGVLFHVQEDPTDAEGPLLRWEYFEGVAWRELPAEDGTRGLRVPGIASLLTQPDDAPLTRFDAPLARRTLSWIRARLAEDAPPGAPTIAAIHPNAAWAVQVQTVVDEALGSSTGEPAQTFAFRQVPVLTGTRVSVREVAGRRADVEWRQVAMEVFGGDSAPIRTLETRLSAEGPETEIEEDPILLRRDRLKRVTEVWVRWRERETLFLSGPFDRDYVVDRARGRITFGDGTLGKVPPAGAAILARRYRAGGGRAGNVPAKAISQLLGPAGGIDGVENPLPAEGGADGEVAGRVASRGPKSLRHRGRAVTPQDYEALAYEAAPDLGWVRALSCHDGAGRRRPGWVTLLVIPDSDAPRPWPSFGLRERIRAHVADRSSAALADAARVVVIGPRYFPVDVEATIVAVDPAESGAVAARARTALAKFLHPVHGGPAEDGWELGRDVFLSDVASVLEHVDGLDYVRELALFTNQVRRGERAEVPDERVVVAGELRLKVGA